MKYWKRIYLILLFALLLFDAPAFALNSITLSPGSDIEFTKFLDSRTLYVQIIPAEEGIQLFIEVDTSM